MTSRILHSGMTGSPTLSGSAGALVGVLQACLVDGWGQQSVDSIVVSGGVATVTRGAGLSVEVDQVQLISGVTTPSALNGQHRVLTRVGNTYTFDATGIADQTATGAPQHKVAPAGWANAFPTAGNIAAFKSAAAEATGAVVRVDDTGTRSARAVGYESMSDLNTGVGPTPTAAQVSGGVWWIKSDATSTARREWMLVADERSFSLAVFHHGSYTSAEVSVSFGDFKSARGFGGFEWCIVGHPADYAGSPPSAGPGGLESYDGASAYTYVPRNWTGAAGAVACYKTTPLICAQLNLGSRWNSGAGTGVPAYPNYCDGGLYVAPIYLTESSLRNYRGEIPGVLSTPLSIPSGAIGYNATVTDSAGRRLRAVPTYYGMVFLDGVGQWR